MMKLLEKLNIILTPYHTSFPTAGAQIVNSIRNVRAPSWSIRQLQYVVYLCNFTKCNELLIDKNIDSNA